MDRVELKKQTCERLFGNLASSPDNRRERYENRNIGSR